MSPAPDEVRVLYGSQTGTAEEVAWDLVREGRKRGVLCADPAALNELTLKELGSLKFAVFVIATTGQGDPPVNMRRLWQDLVDATLSVTLLQGLSFAVFGLGDSHYREFNYAARKMHARLKRLGAKDFFRIGLGDDQHDFGLEQELDPWAEGLWAALAELRLTPPAAAPAPGAAACEDRRFDVEVLDAAPAAAEVCPAPGAAGAGVFEATVAENGSLCSAAHAEEHQDVRHIALRLPEGQGYEAGDVCVVWPRADPELVRRFVVETLGLDLHARVRVRPLRRGGGHAAESVAFPDAPLTFEEVFSSYVDISAVPSRHFFAVLARHTTHELHHKKLSEFASRTLEAKDALYEYCKREKRSAAEVMWDFWTARPPLADLLSALPPMRPRRYSIASCPAWSLEEGAAERLAAFWSRYVRPLQPATSAWRPAGTAAARACAEAAPRCGPPRLALELCVAVVRFTTKTGREGRGLCSTFLQQAEAGARVPCSLEGGSLAPLPLAEPMIFVCPGTGLSPCRALVQDRHLKLRRQQAMLGGEFHQGRKDLMFLGFRHEAGDFLYAGEWSMYSSWLSVYVAFSRDHEDRKVYVQDCVEEHGAEVCDLLDAGAHVFVCGRAHPMPAQVFDAFSEVLQVHRALTADAAAARLRDLQRSRRYICDTWG